MKRCPDCGETKTLDAFHAATRNRDGRNTYCAPCAAERSRRWYEANKVRARARQKAYNAEHADEISAAGRRWRQANPERVRDASRRYAERNPDQRRASSRSYRRRLNSWPDVLVEQRLVEQDNRCAICLTAITVEDCHADHCHATEQPRGLLCEFCNHGLGRFRDDAASLERAIAYLNHYSTVTS